MNGQEKFDTCQFRSTEQHLSFEQKRCCGKEQKVGYLCFKTNIDDVTPAICESCIYYKPKENV